MALQRRCSAILKTLRPDAVHSALCEVSIMQRVSIANADASCRGDGGAFCPLIDPSPPCSHRRRFSSVSKPDATTFHYIGPLSKPVKNLKRLSIAGCLASVVGGPLLVFGTAGNLPLAAQLSICVTVGGFGIFTTSLLHWFTSPYVHSLKYDRQSKIVRTETLSLLAKPIESQFHESEVQFPDTMRPQVTFQARDTFFYLDADNFQDKELLERLTPSDPAEELNAQEESKKAVPS